MRFPAVPHPVEPSALRAVAELLGRGDRANRRRWLYEADGARGLELLDHPALPGLLLTEPDVRVPANLVIYCLIRNAFLQRGIAERDVADFATGLVLTFGEGTRAWTVPREPDVDGRYLTDILIAARDADPAGRFLLYSHLGHYSLWLCGLFPGHIVHRANRRGAPEIGYYDAMGAGRYMEAAKHPMAESTATGELLAALGRRFVQVRSALNLVSSNHFFPDRPG